MSFIFCSGVFADLYECEESTYSLNEKNKMKVIVVKVKRRSFKIDEEGTANC
jgi:hypothetical protein